MLILSQEAICQTADDEARFKEFWKEFARVVQANDTAAFKKMSLEKIECDLCLTNTFEEVLQFEKFKKKNPKTWEKKYKSELVYVSIDEFLKNDFGLFFDSTAINHIEKATTYIHVSDVSIELDAYIWNQLQPKFAAVKEKDSLKFYSVSIPITHPPTTEINGCDLDLIFIETQTGLKLYLIAYSAPVLLIQEPGIIFQTD